MAAAAMASSFPEILTVPKAISSTVCARVSPRIPSVRITRRPSQRIHSASNGDRNVSIAASEAAERREARLRELIAEQMAQVEEEEKPYRFVDGRKYYLDELDIPGFLDGSRYLRPSDPETYNPAVFLWKKIGDIPEERRHRLLGLLKPHHITLMWDAAGNRFQLEQEDGEEGADPVTSAGGMLPDVATSAQLQPEIWDGRVIGVPGPLLWLSRFQKSFFVGADGLRYGRVISGLSNVITPLYFRIRAATNVLATDEPCDLSFDYESGQLHLKDSGLPEGFPDPRTMCGRGGAGGDSGAVMAGGAERGGRGQMGFLHLRSILRSPPFRINLSCLSPTLSGPHPPIFDDDFRDYVRAAGPGVIVGQSWQEGREVDAEPRQFLGEFILVRRHPHQVNVLY
ncbi:unnamed protein product [Closterium sp. NIES-64]|nr:unnamed protein product [Closterium sp. NIES-64]